MANLIDNIKSKAKQLKKHILLPDAIDERAIQAARIITDEYIATISLIGNEETIKKKAQQLNVGLEKISIIDPATLPSANPSRTIIAPKKSGFFIVASA